MIKSIERFVTLIALVAGYALLLQAIITAIEIVGRKLFNFSFQGVDEIGGYVLAITASFGFGYALLTRSHTRVDFLLQRLPVAIRAALHFCALLVLAAISAGMLWYATAALNETLEYGSIANSPLETPIWIPQSLWLTGFIAFLLIACLLSLRAGYLLFTGQFDQLDQDFGPPTVDEEIAAVDEELAEVGNVDPTTGQGR